MSIESLVSQIVGITTEAAADAEKFDRGNDAAGRRIRKACMEVSRACKDIRAQVQLIRNDRKG